MSTPASHFSERVGSIGLDPALVYKKLRRHFGFLNWWPAETKFEVLVGAILTQQTSWKNVEKSIKRLKDAHALKLDKIARMDLPTLERLVRQSGFYRQKARRLKEACMYIMSNYGSLDNFLRLGTMELRESLLNLNGIGRETADSIILYAAAKPIFVIDAYTRRIMSRLTGGAIIEDIDYDALRGYFESRIEKDLELYKDFHAQFVELGKNYCKVRPDCPKCPLKGICMYAKNKA